MEFFILIIVMVWVYSNILFWETVLEKHPFKWWWYMEDTFLTIAFLSASFK